MKTILRHANKFFHHSQENIDILFSIVFIILGIYLLIVVNKFPKFESEKFGPAFYPEILSWLLIVCSSCVIFKSISRVKYKEDKSTRNTSKSLKGVFFAVFMTLFLVLVIEKIGFIISTIIFLLVTMEFFFWRTKGFNYKQFFLVAFISISTSAVIWFVFSIVMKVMLPSGTLF